MKKVVTWWINNITMNPPYRYSTYWTLILIISLCASCYIPINRSNKIKVAKHKGLTSWQMDENKRFRDPDTSPLEKDKIKTFESLDFFPYDPQFKVTANLLRTPDSPVFEMTTTTDRRPKYRQYGILTFILLDQELQLKVYQSIDLSDKEEFKKLLFLPFYDGTTGESTYGGGRYINLKIPDGNSITIDFNEAYNPYCAYRDGFSCPITPLENNLPSIKIKAGTKAYDKHE